MLNQIFLHKVNKTDLVIADIPCSAIKDSRHQWCGHNQHEYAVCGVDTGHANHGNVYAN